MKIAYDAVLKRPGCALLQAAYGCDPQLAHMFDTDLWLVGPTPNLACMEIDASRLPQLVSITIAARGL